MGKAADWYCGHCHHGPMNLVLEAHCTECARARDTYAILPQFTGQSSPGSSASFGTAHRSSIAIAGKADISSAQPTSQGTSPKSGSPIDIGHDVRPEKMSASLTKISKHVHGPSERKSPLEEPANETQSQRKPDKSAITEDKISISEDTYEQWIADGILRDDSGDTKLSDDVEPKYVHESSSDPESDLDSVLGPLTEPRTGDRSSDDLDTSEQTRTKFDRRPLLPPVIYMLLVRVCDFVTRVFEPNPLPGRRRVRWRCVSYSRHVLLMQNCLFT